MLDQSDGKLETMFQAAYTFASAPLYAIYGDKDPGGPAGPDGGKRVALDPAQRAGILTMAAPLAVHASPNQSNPVLRGKWVRESLLCQELPPPPPDVNTSLPPVDPKVTTRERFRQHRQDAACRGCHELLDPVGLAFESYDLVGRWRAMDGVNPVDATGEVVGGEGALAGPFSGALALGAKLVPSEALRQCVSRQWMTTSTGAPPRTKG